MIAGETFSQFVDGAEFRSGMRGIAAPVALATTRGPDGPAGLTVSSFCSLSVDPPRILVCINRDSSAYPVIAGRRVLALNVLAAHHETLAMRFASGDACRGEARFAAGRWAPLRTGAPVLEDALVGFDCRIVRVHEEGSHGIIVGDVVATTGSGATSPLLYRDGHFVTSTAPARQGH
ncbi:NADH:FAD oxidoreductase [wastewater metagenome]|uniref:NADH:FAD oxidoreductase n=2 Tax=unclassified sequences TaxID=12908 RepID=A0A5B8RI66_9ZZZZ|nr:NADH:FAD oxidoreductase [uncultured organism]